MIESARPAAAGGEAPPGERRQAAHALQAQLGEARDERRRVVDLAPSKVDLVGDLAVGDDEDPVGIGRGLRIVGDEDDRLVPLDARAPERVRGSPCPVV